ncbi:MAG: 3-deoxy-D-manno-octulosonic acid transferase [Fusobacteriota bacterium]
MIYNIIRYLGGIILSPFLIFKYKFLKKRLFSYKKISFGDYIWFHMSSVGEVNLSERLIKKIASTDEKILITVMTDTGMSIAKKMYKELKNVHIIYFPLDDKFFIKKLVNKINIKLLVLIETEIWPNLINEVSKKSEIILINGRISDKSYKSYFKIKFLLKNVLNKIDHFFMQTEKDKKRIITLGAIPSNVSINGNLKFNISLPKEKKKDRDKIISKYNINKKIFVAGSTHDGEEKFILENLDLNKFFLFLVPRHITRVEKVERYLNDNNYDYIKWSQKFDYKFKGNIVLVDKMGVLTKLYQIADLVFVGGSLVNVGGHNLLEPLHYGKKPIFGPYMQNAKEIAKEVLNRNIGHRIKTSKDFQEVVSDKLKKDEDSQRKMVVKKDFKIKTFFEENQNGLDQIIKYINKKV